MSVTPDFSTFEAAYTAGRTQLVYRIRSADLDTPVSAYMRIADADSPSFLLESVEKGNTRGRYSLIGMMPDLMWRCHGPKAEIATVGDGAPVYAPCAEDSLASFRTLYRDSQFDVPDELPPMASGLIGYMTYDMVRLMEKLPDSPPDVINIPDACFMRPQMMVIFDSVADKMYLITPVRPGKHSAKAAYDAALARIDSVTARLSHAVPQLATGNEAPVTLADFKSNTERTYYDSMLERAREYMRAGDIFQVVLSQRFSAPFTLPPFSLYRSLRYLNPSPFLFYLNFGSFQLVGSSPEILVRLRDGEVTIRPIAGTRKRGRNKAEDEALAADLLADPKELSEHLMLLDLGRNDVGRVAKTGTVKTTQHMTIENYSHVMHIVSNVVGELNDKEYDALEALVAGFPAGTVSGAPKVRAMEIIDELEKERRSFYAGCVGYFSANGNMDTCITLRTGLVKDGKLYIQAGGGIVAESVNEDEYQESLNKAKALMRAAEEAIHFI